MRYRRLRSPKDHGGRLIDPPLSDVPARLLANREAARQREFDLQGRSFGELANAARSHLLDAAIGYTSRYRNVADSLSDSAGLQCPVKPRFCPRFSSVRVYAFVSCCYWHGNLLVYAPANNSGPLSEALTFCALLM